MLEAAAADIEFRAGRFVIAGTDRAIGLMELAAKIREGLELPPDLPQSLDVADIYDGPPSAFPNGCHIAEVEVDPDTGMAEVVKYTFVNDFGVVINPLLVDGQAHGGIVQGIGQALLRMHRVRRRRAATDRVLYGLRDAARRATRRCSATRAIRCRPRPTRSAPRAAARPAAPARLPSVMNALVDALSEYGISHIDMPATPERVWRAIQEARGG